MPISDPDFGKAQPCICTLKNAAWERAVHLRQVSNLSQLERLTFERFSSNRDALPEDIRLSLRTAYNITRKFAQDPSGWLVLHGSYGTGKTHLGRGHCQCAPGARSTGALRRHARSVGLFARHVFPQSNVTFDQRFEEVRGTPLLILDDLGAHSTTPWAQEKLYQIINHRYNAHLPTVITTNLRLDDLDERVRSRLVRPEISVVLHIITVLISPTGETYDSLELNSLAMHEDQRFDNFDLRGHELNGERRASLAEALAVAQRFAVDQNGWLIFSGSYNCGKTHLAATDRA